MPTYDYCPPEYMEVSRLPEYFGMSRQNLYQSGLMAWIEENHDIYTIGRSLIVSVDVAHKIYYYLEWRKHEIKAGRLPSNTPLISSDNLAAYEKWLDDNVDTE